jgi:hypothetical protein
MENILNNHQDFRNELSALLKKYDCDIVSVHDEDLSVNFHNGDTVPLNEVGYGYAGHHNIGAVAVEEAPKPKRQRKRREKNPLRRWIYEYNRYNPQLGTSVRKGEVYAKTAKEAERTAIRHCNDYTAYGSLSFKRIVQVSQPITLGIDVKERVRHYDSLKKSYNEYEEVYGNHTDGFNNLTDWVEA